MEISRYVRKGRLFLLGTDKISRDYYDNQAVPYGVAGGYHCAFILCHGIRGFVYEGVRLKHKGVQILWHCEAVTMAVYFFFINLCGVV